MLARHPNKTNGRTRTRPFCLKTRGTLSAPSYHPPKCCFASIGRGPKTSQKLSPHCQFFSKRFAVGENRFGPSADGCTAALRPRISAACPAPRHAGHAGGGVCAPLDLVVLLEALVLVLERLVRLVGLVAFLEVLVRHVHLALEEVAARSAHAPRARHGSWTSTQTRGR